MEKPDVIGAIFGQTEGLLGADLDLRELQRTGRIGRIDVELDTNEAKTSGRIMIPSSLDSSETALIAASLETIERIGPCFSEIKVGDVKDVRAGKREFMMDRAKDILQNLIVEEMPSTTALSERIRENARTMQVQEYEGMVCGPDALASQEIIILEGRADVLNLLKNGIKNVVAIGGAVIPQNIVDFSKQKATTLFVDGDRAGELIIKEMLQLADVDYITRAPAGKEVEELSKKEIFKALREKLTAEQYKEQTSVAGPTEA
ncbi:MAG TPA: DNA primase DnaG [archaeon]|nr:DNA primase DnaG [archaeon]